MICLLPNNLIPFSKAVQEITGITLISRGISEDRVSTLPIEGLLPEVFAIATKSVNIAPPSIDSTDFKDEVANLILAFLTGKTPVDSSPRNPRMFIFKWWRLRGTGIL